MPPARTRTGDFPASDSSVLLVCAPVNAQLPASDSHYELGYLFPILLKYETDPRLKKFYNELIDEWMANQESGENLINNLTYAISTGKTVNTRQTVEFLRDAPLDLVDWHIDHTLREDVKVVRTPVLEEIQVDQLPPASIRATVRWDKNPWSAINGNPRQVREPVFWLWPYWMARHLGVIRPGN